MGVATYTCGDLSQPMSVKGAQIVSILMIELVNQTGYCPPRHKDVF